MIFARFSDDAMVQLTETVGASRPVIYLVLLFSLVTVCACLWFMHKKDHCFMKHLQTHETAEKERMQAMSDMHDACHDVNSEHIKTVTEATINTNATLREIKPILSRVAIRLENNR